MLASRFIYAFLIIELLVLLGGDPAHSQDKWMVGSQEQVRALNMVQIALTAYQSSHGKWPKNWKELRESGIWQSVLLNEQGQALDPDNDGPPKLGSGLNYRGVDSEGRAVLVVLVPRGAAALQSEEERTWRLEPQPDYSQRLKWLDSQGFTAARGITLADYIDDKGMLGLFAICGVIEEGLKLYTLENSGGPEELDQLIDSGYCPVDRQSINPRTGARLKFDGSRGELKLSFDKDGKLTGVWPVLSDGKELKAPGVF